jgi:hypothetical protein
MLGHRSFECGFWMSDGTHVQVLRGLGAKHIYILLQLKCVLVRSPMHFRFSLS